ncbi:MAG: hypothetical protein ISQ14_01060 [Verrucomicrobiae bacterium]|nr:hypothetical protein [Verrucomicrobiae bacterium]
MKSRPSTRKVCLLMMAMGVVLRSGGTASAQRVPEFEEDPIHYSATITSNRADRLQNLWFEGRLEGVGDYGKAALRAFLAAFEIPIDSQTLVFSKTSLQNSRIEPRNPRAIYFSDDAYFGWVPGGIYELALNDPRLGLVFYEIDPYKKRIARNRDCLSCHGGSRTGDWPGVLVRSVYPESDGNVLWQGGSHVTRQDSPIEQRWGGWYVTGQHGAARHLGNEFATWDGTAAVLDTEAGANATDLGGRFDTSKHLRPDSDIVALMVLEHQCEMHSRLSRAKLRILKWQAHQEDFYKRIGEPAPSEPTGTLLTVLNGERDRILEYLLFRDEIQLPDGGIRGAGRFEAAFLANRKPDTLDRSLKDFDLQTRLFRYRCSYMIYSEAFDLLPVMLKRALYAELETILRDSTPTDRYSHLTAKERRDIRDILFATKPEMRELLKDHEPR